jgi:hypothetical protein
MSFLPNFCDESATVVWTRHREPPDLTPAACPVTQVGTGLPASSGTSCAASTVPQPLARS